jgi:hypothetical protein
MNERDEIIHPFFVYISDTKKVKLLLSLFYFKFIDYSVLFI